MGRNPSLLLVDADTEHRGELRQLLGGMPYAVAGEAAYGVEATRLAGELQPDLILLHLEEPLALAFRTLNVLQEAAPRSTPVVISSRIDGETARKAMLSGARGFVATPATADTLDAVLSEARLRHARSFELASAPAVSPTLASGTVLTVFGPKGGVGKTTLATNLAIAIRRRTEARVALVDIDADFGDVAVIMGIEPTSTIRELLDARSTDPAWSVAPYVTRHSSGVDVLAARHGAQVGAPPEPEVVSALLRHLARSYDFVVVDTPGAFIPQVAAALDESTTVLLVTSTDMSSIKDARLAVTTLGGSGFDTDRLKLVVNHATNANSVTDADIERTVGYQVFWTLPHDKAVPLSTQLGEPIVISRPQAMVAKRMEALAAHLSGTATVAPAVKSRRGVFWR